MIGIVFLALLHPQESDPVELVRAIQRNVVEHATVAGVEDVVKAPWRARVDGFTTPAFALRLRDAGLGSLGIARGELWPVATESPDVVQPDVEPPGAKDALALIERLWGDGPSRERPPKAELEDFADFCSVAHREIVQAIGSGRDAARMIPSLRAAIESLAQRTENLGSLEAADIESLRERLDRIAKVEPAKLRAIALRVVAAALELNRPELLERARRTATSRPRADAIVQGEVLLDRDAAFGRMVIGGFERNTYDCSQLDVIIDLGGDDEYRGPAGGAGERGRLAIVIDLSGDDVYRADHDALGSATLGVGVLIDVSGDDHYEATGRSAGFGLAGFGAFLDLDGNDEYRLGNLSAGAAIAGTGLFFDGGGDDRVHAGLESFGVGLPGGVGVYVDLAGNDLRRAARSAKAVTDGGDHDVSIAFGVGLGAPPWLAPGLGVFLDLSGNDRLHAGGVAGGVGGRGGVGIYLDAAGDDTCIFGDLACGVGYARGIGLLIDEGGSDVRTAGRFAHGSANDEGIGVSFDASGEDRIVASTPALGSAERHAEGAFIDLDGVDSYALDSDLQPFRIAGVPAGKGKALGVFLDLGGATDRFEFHGILAPENGRTRMLTGGESGAPHKHVFVDR